MNMTIAAQQQEPRAYSAFALAEQVKSGQVRAVSRLISLLEDQHPHGTAALHHLAPPGEAAAVVGITGYPGAGKSSLINRLVGAYRRLGMKVGVLAVDISSRVTGGALLGDRIRMQDHALDRDVYIRSMATRGHPEAWLAPRAMPRRSWRRRAI